MAHTNNYIYIDSEDNLGVTTEDVRDVLGENTNDIGALCTSDMINPMSVRKPFRSVKTRVNMADLSNTYYGFGTSSPPLIRGLGELPAVWEYQKPRGKGGGLLGSNEWYRLKDFAGYYQDAVAPMKVLLYYAGYASSEYGETGNVSIRVDFNSAISGWDAKSLSMQQLIGGIGSKNLLNKYIAFVIYDEDAECADLCITSMKFSEALNQSNIGFSFPKESTTYGGVEYPGLSTLTAEHVGDNLTAIICASSYVIPTGLSYQIFNIESISSPGYALCNSCYSLEFIEGVDRDTAKLINVRSISGTTGHITSLTVTPTGYIKIVNGYQYKQYYFQVKGNIDTREANWTYGNRTVPIEVGFIVINPNSSTVLMGEDIGNTGVAITSDAFVPNSTVPSAQFAYRGSVSLEPNTLYEDMDLMYNNGYGEYTISDYIWLMKPTTETVSARVTVAAQLKQPGDPAITISPLQQPVILTF